MNDEEMLEFLEENSERVGSMINFLPKKHLKLLTLQEFFSLKSDWIELDDGRIRTKAKIAYSKEDDAFYKKMKNQWFYVQFPKMPSPMTEEEIEEEVETLENNLKNILYQLKKVGERILILDDNLNDLRFDMAKYTDLKVKEVIAWVNKELNR